MALVLADRVQETTTTAGTGALTLDGAVGGFQSFAVVGNGNICYYTVVDGTSWEVGIGTYSTTGPTLSRTTVLSNSSGTTSPLTLSSASKPVFLTYPAEKSVNLDSSGNVSPLGTVSSGTWQGSTVGVAYGGTGVTSSSGANSVMLRDANQNVTINRLNQSSTTITAAGGTTTLTAASTFSQILVGTGGQTFKLPDATTLTNTTTFEFNNNATGTLTITDYANATVGTVSSGGAAALALLANGTVGGTWDVHAYIPENVTWGTNSLALGATVITGGTWNGGTITPAYGGTGLTSYTSGGAIYATGTSTLTSGTLPVASGGTGATTAAGAQSNLNVPSTTGSGASGTWNINISGNAATATTATNQSGGTVNATTATVTPNTSGVSTGLNVVNGDITTYRSGGTTGVIYLSNSGTKYVYWDGASYNMPGGPLYVNSSLVLTAANYNSYAPTLTGGGASGTWGINISGNAATATSASSSGNLSGGTISGNYTVANATSPYTYYLQWGDNTGWIYRYMTSVSGTPTERFSFNDTGIFQAFASARAPIFYDSNNTAYYLDPTSTSVLSAINLPAGSQSINTTTPGTSTYQLNFTGQGTADYAQAITWGWSSSGAQAGIYVQSSGSYGTKMYLATTDSFATGAKTAVTIDHLGVITTTRNYLQATGSLRAPIFYDSDDTTYYLDPNNTGIALSSNGIVSSGYGTNGGFQNRIYTSGRNRIWSFGNADAYGISYFQGGPDYIGLHFGTTTAAASQFWVSDSGISQTSASSRAPIFYDSNNTGYYLDPASTSNLNAVLTSSAVSDNNIGLRTMLPGGGAYITGSSTVSGAIVITLPTTNYPMVRFTVKVYTYDGLSFDITCGGHTSGGTWYNTFAYMTTQNRSALNVRFCYGGGVTYVYIGDLGASWSYPQVFITDVQVGYSTYSYSQWNAGWSIGFNSSTYNNVSATHTVYPPTSSSNNTSPVYAPIFYDSNNTGYYCDPNSASRLSNISLDTYAVTSGITGLTSAPLYTQYANAGSTNTWYPMTYQLAQHSGGYVTHLNTGLYKSASGWGSGATGWYAAIGGNDSYPTQAWYLTYDGYIQNSLGYVYTGGSFRAPIFYDSDNTGYYVDPAGTSNLNTTTSVNFRMGNALYLGANNYYINNNYDWFGSNASFRNSVDIRAPIFYDYDNTGYYVDPTGTSILNIIAFGGSAAYAFSSNAWAGTGGYPGYVYSGGNSRFGFSSTAGAIDVYTDGNFYGGNDYYGASRLVPLFDANQGGGALYSSILYDSNDTTYYIDPATYTYVANGIVNNGAHGSSYIIDRLLAANNGAATGEVRLQMWCSEPGNTWDWGGFGYNVDNTSNSNSPVYFFGRPNANFGQAYMRMSPAGDWYFYNTNTTPTRYTTMVLTSSGYAYANASFRAPIFYDLDNTGYYCDPNGTSRMGTINADVLYSYGNVTAYSDERLKTDWEILPEDFVEKLAKVKSGTYTRIDSGERQAGVGAQSLQGVLKEAVSEKEQYLGVNYGNAAMVSAVELAKYVTALEQRISQLEARL